MRVGVTLAAIGLGLRDRARRSDFSSSLRARVVLAARDRAHPRVVLVGGLEELVVVGLDVLELLASPRQRAGRLT